MADSDIRRLMDSDKPTDWQLALRQPNFGPEDMDHLLARLKAEAVYRPGEKTKTLPYVHQLVNHPEFKSHHLHDLMDIRVKYPPGSVTDDMAARLGGYVHAYGDQLPNMMGSKAFDAQAVDRVLASPPHWIGGPPDVERLLEEPAVGPHHIDRLLQLASFPDTRLEIGGVSNLKPWMNAHPDVDPKHLDNWLNWGIKNKHVDGNGLLIEALAHHPRLSDAGVQKLIASDHPRRDVLRFRQLNDSQFKAFVGDPRFQDPQSRLYGMWNANLANAIHHQERISPENLELAAQSPHPTVRSAVAARKDAPPDLITRMAEHDRTYGVRLGITQNDNAPPEALDKVARGANDDFYAAGSDRENNMGILDSVVENPKLSSGTIQYLMDPTKERANRSGSGLLRQSMRRALGRHPNLTVGQMNDLAADPEHQVVTGLLDRKDLPAEVVHTAFSSPSLVHFHKAHVQSEILRRPELARHLRPEDLRNWATNDPDFDKSGEETYTPALQHPNLPRDVLFRSLAHPGAARLAVANPNLTAADVMKLFTAPENHDNEGLKSALLGNPNVNADHLTIAARDPSDAVRSAAAEHRQATPELLASMHDAISALPDADPLTDSHRFPATQAAIAANPNTSAELLHRIVGDDRGDFVAAIRALHNPNVEDETLKTAAGHHLTDIARTATEVHGLRHPDTKFDRRRRVEVKPGVGKLRAIRDLIWEKDPVKGEARPKDLPAGDWALGRLANGNIGADKLQQVIDAAPSTAYNTSDDRWAGAQRHSQTDSNVFQVNLTDDHVQKMKAAGVYPTFLEMQKLSEHSGHPVIPGHTVGWVRWTVDHRGEGIHVDEIQSDLGQDFVRAAKEQAHAAGEDPEAAAHEAARQYPPEHQKVISNILFAGKHPNEMVGEAFMQHLRNINLHRMPVHIHDAETKAPLSDLDPGKPIPGHMQFTYNQLPKKMGMKPSTYGKLPTQDNPALQGKPTWEGKVRKFEDDLSTWLEDRAPQDMSAQLGLRGAVDRRLQAALSLGYPRPDALALHRALVAADDIDSAVRRTIPGIDVDTLAAVTALTRGEPEPNADRPPTSIVAETPSAEPVAEGLKRAFHGGHVKNVFLGGKHSAGSMIARDPESGQKWLLKPGSGGQSPALGVDEEVASQARREAGFWHLAQLLGLDRDLPRAETVNMDGHDWAAMNFLGEGWKNFDDVRRAQPGVAIETLERLRRHGLLHRWATLDWIAGNVDRHGANLMIGPQGGVKLIDHGSAFAGPSFNPGRDPNSFIPFYLRYRVPRWSKIAVEHRLDVMANLSQAEDEELRRWVQGIDVDRVATSCIKDGLNPEPVVARLRRLQELAGQPGFAMSLNRLWAGV